MNARYVLCVYLVVCKFLYPSTFHIRLMLMDIKTYTQLNIHTRHILHSYKAYVDGYKNLHTTKYTHKTYLAFI